MARATAGNVSPVPQELAAKRNWRLLSLLPPWDTVVPRGVAPTQGVLRQILIPSPCSRNEYLQRRKLSCE